MEEVRSTAVAEPASGEWAGTDDGTDEPDIVLASAGDVVTLEVIVAAQPLGEKLPAMRTRVVNVVDLMALRRPEGPPARDGSAVLQRSSPTTST